MARSCLLNPRWRQRVFSVDTHEYCWLDVFLAAMLRGEWQSFTERLVEGLACLAEAQSGHQWPAASRVEEAATAFRYDRDLLTSEETVAWIERQGLTLDDWTDYLAGRLLRDDWNDRLQEIVRRHAGSLTVADGAFVAEGVCSEVFDGLLETLAARAAVSATVPDAGAHAGLAADEHLERIRAEHAKWLEGLDSSDVSRRLAHVSQLESTYASQTHVRATDKALAAQLARNGLGWMRVDLERLSFTSIDAASEAAWCVREDGLTLSEVAIESRLSVRDTRELLDRLEPELRDAVLGAGVDELIGPIAVGPRYEVAWVVGKSPPSLTDRIVRVRAEEAVIEQLVSKAILSHIRWVERPRL